jgi:general secretion pathway protein G
MRKRYNVVADSDQSISRNACVPADPWGHVSIDRTLGENGPYEIVSLGSDGQGGGTGMAADISNEQTPAAAR